MSGGVGVQGPGFQGVGERGGERERVTVGGVGAGHLIDALADDGLGDQELGLAVLREPERVHRRPNGTGLALVVRTGVL